MLDVAIIGGGVAGLWLLRDLIEAGYDAALLEKDALGAGQTLAAQGIIHGGLKYRLGATVDTTLDRRLRQMPSRWRREASLRDTLRSSETTWMSTSRTMSWLARLFAQGDRRTIAPYPGFADAFALHEPVVDVRAVLHALDAPARAFRAEVTEVDTGRLRCRGGLAISAAVVVALAGAGNARFLGKAQPVPMRLRPLRMFIVRGVPIRFFGHCITPGLRSPRVTITTHYHRGEPLWYLGGQIAEHTAAMPPGQAITRACDEMQALFPWIDWQALTWTTAEFTRAEPAPGHAPIVRGPGGVACAWPTKLALAPALADALGQHIAERRIRPRHTALTPIDLPRAPLGKYPWELGIAA